MLYNSEVTFLGKFIASLKLYNISNIPFDNTDFYAGIESMNVYFQANKSILGELSDEISMLFIKNPFERIYKRFRDAISDQNGRYMSFVNPEYVIGMIKMTEMDANFIMGKDDSDIPKSFVEECTLAFCKGAGILMPSISN